MKYGDKNNGGKSKPKPQPKSTMSVQAGMFTKKMGTKKK
jgi:hypothetical protein